MDANDRERSSRDPLTRALAVLPLIAAAGDDIEARCELPAGLLDALHEAALFRALLPKVFGGDECEPATFVELIEAIAQADASTAWCIGQASGCSMASAYVKPEVAREIWGNDRRAVLAWGAGPLGIARAVDGGYRVTGKWPFASGGRHATWLGGHCRVEERDGTPRRGPEGEPVERTMLFRREAARMPADWKVMGLRGTGSDSYAVEDLLVPEDFTLARDNDAERQQPGTLYRFSTTHLYASSFAAVALGIARAALDAFKTLARQKTPWAGAGLLRDSPLVQTHVGLSEAKLSGARVFLIATLRDVWDAVRKTGAITLDQRMAIRMASTLATHQATEVVDTAYHEAGATAIFEGNAFERRFRDLHTVTQQVQARATHFETVGAHLLGLKPNLRFI